MSKFTAAERIAIKSIVASLSIKERINEIYDLQKKHHAIVDSPTEPTTVKQASLAELHKLNITLSNYFDVAPSIINGNTLSITPQSKATITERPEFIV